MRSFHFPGRSPVYGRRAMCATSHPAATLTAIETLRQGGNAVDAAIATVAVLCVVEPQMTGIGGDCFALIAKPGRKKLIALSGSWPCSCGRDGRVVRRPGHQAHRDHLRACRDGARRHRRLVPPASPTTAACRSSACWHRPSRWPKAASWSRRAWPPTGPTPCARASSRAPAPRSTCSKTASRPRPDEVWRFPALAKTLKAIAAKGRDGFYAGEVAADIVAELKAMGGLHTLEDFAAQSSTYVDPISVLLSRRRAVRAAAQQPRHRGADHAEDAGAPRQASGQSGLGRALSPADGGGAARLRHARYLRRRPRHGRRAGRAHAETMLQSTNSSKRIDRKKHRPELGADAAAGRLRHRVLLHRRREGHGRLVHQLAVRRLRHRHRHQQDRRHLAQPRRGLRARSPGTATASPRASGRCTPWCRPWLCAMASSPCRSA